MKRQIYLDLCCVKATFNFADMFIINLNWKCP